MKALPAVLVAALMVLGGLPLLAGTSTAEDANPTDYTAKTVMASGFEVTEHSFYGTWQGTPVYSSPSGSATLATTYDIDDKTQGNASRDLVLSWNDAISVLYTYSLITSADVPSLRHYTVQFDYKIEMTGNTDNISVDLWRSSQVYTPLVLIYSQSSESLLSSGAGSWHTWTGSLYDTQHANDEGGINYNLAFQLKMNSGVIPKDGSVELHIDNVRFIAPQCDVRFTYYNAYTGLGLESDLLITQVWHDGVWQRVWNNEYVIAAGEQVAYMVTDYFGQTVAMSKAFYLNDTAVYIDLPVPLVKVHITKPAWYDTSLPPTWYLTYTSTGVEIPVEGWDLELIAGLYSFRWDGMVVSTGNDTMDESDDLVVQAGSISQYIDGNLSSGQSFTVCDFYLSMKPTYTATSNETMAILPSLYSWDGLAKFANEFVDEIYGNTWYKSIMLTIGIAGVITWAGAAWTKGKKAAAKAAKEKEGGKQ